MHSILNDNLEQLNNEGLNQTQFLEGNTYDIDGYISWNLLDIGKHFIGVGVRNH